jgi:lipoprotein-releasing system permease protein
MNLSLKIARRYLFSNSIGGVVFVLLFILLFPFSLLLLILTSTGIIKLKSVNAINVISGISVFGISIGTAALILVLSVFNGFEDLISGLFGAFNPDVKIIALKGKTFEVDSTMIKGLKQIEGVQFFSQTLEEIAFFEYKGNQDFGIVKGVDEFYKDVTSIDSTIREGELNFDDGKRYLAVLGVGMRNKLSVNVDDYLSPITIYMAKRSKSAVKPFKKRFIYPIGTFVIQQDFDNQYVLTSLDFARKLMDMEKRVSALELRLDSDFDESTMLSQIREFMGSEYVVKNRYQQEEAFLKLMNVEKWMSFAILSLTLILVAFNLIGSLWMIVLDKRKDIAILKSMGATNKTVRNIFLNEGLMLCTFGMLIGFFFAIILFVSQKTFGVVPIPEGFVVDAYPISIRLFDFIVVAITVLVIGLVAALPPAMKASKVSALIREE